MNELVDLEKWGWLLDRLSLLMESWRRECPFSTGPCLSSWNAYVSVETGKQEFKWEVVMVRSWYFYECLCACCCVTHIAPPLAWRGMTVSFHVWRDSRFQNVFFFWTCYFLKMKRGSPESCQGGCTDEKGKVGEEWQSGGGRRQTDRVEKVE